MSFTYLLFQRSPRGINFEWTFLQGALCGRLEPAASGLRAGRLYRRGRCSVFSEFASASPSPPCPTRKDGLWPTLCHLAPIALAYSYALSAAGENRPGEYQCSRAAWYEGYQSFFSHFGLLADLPWVTIEILLLWITRYEFSAFRVTSLRKPATAWLAVLLI